MTEQLNIAELRRLIHLMASDAEIADRAQWTDNYTDAARARTRIALTEQAIRNALPALLDAAEEGIAERERFNILSQRCAAAEAERDKARRELFAARVEIDHLIAEHDKSQEACKGALEKLRAIDGNTLDQHYDVASWEAEAECFKRQVLQFVAREDALRQLLVKHGGTVEPEGSPASWVSQACAEMATTRDAERDRLKAKLADAIGILDGLMRDMGAAVFGKDADAVEELIAAAKVQS